MAGSQSGADSKREAPAAPGVLSADEADRLAGMFTPAWEEGSTAARPQSPSAPALPRPAAAGPVGASAPAEAPVPSSVPAVPRSITPRGGIAVVNLPDGVAEAEIIDGARSRDLAVDGLASYHIDDHSQPSALVVGYATPAPHAYSTSLARLFATLGKT